MTTLNTIIEEEKKRFDLLWAEDDEPRLRVFAKDFLTTAMQRAYEAGQSEERAKLLEEIESALEDYCISGMPVLDHKIMMGYIRACLSENLTPDKTPNV